MNFQRPQSPVYARRIMGIETEYGITAVSEPSQRRLTPDEVARELFRPVVDKHQATNIFTENASRLYLDVGSHPEVATGECDSLTQLLNYERAGDAIVNELAVGAEKTLQEMGLAKSLILFKNNVDSQGNSYGCHENYLISRHMVLRDISRKLMPFMITRQLICGAGMVAPQKANSPARFVLSQRADQVWEGVSSATTRSRPIINTRDEPHGDSSRFRRMHVIVGDSNMAEPTFALKVGSTQLMLEMIEAEFELPNLEVEDPIAHIRDISTDLTGHTPIKLVSDTDSGSTMTALEIQQVLCDRAEKWLEHRPDEGTPTAELARVVDLWKRTLEAIRTQDFSAVNTEIDWVIKRDLLEKYRDRLDADWAHPKLAQIDLTYHDIRPGRGLYDVLMRKGLISRWTTDESIADSIDIAPQTTRAKLRGEFLGKARKFGADFTVDWTRLKVNRPEPNMEEFSDPFISEDERLAGLIDYIVEHKRDK